MSLHSALPRALLALLLFACAGLALASQTRVATDANGQAIHISGSVVLIEPDIELSEVLAGGVQEPRHEWSARAPPVSRGSAQAPAGRRHHCRARLRRSRHARAGDTPRPGPALE